VVHCAEALAARVSQGCTRLAVLLKPPVSAGADLGPLVDDLRACAIALLHVYRVVPVAAEGLAYRGELQAACVALLGGLADLANSSLDKAAQVTLHHVSPYLFNTGMVWRAAEAFPGLPRDNKGAAVRVWENRQAMMDDALGELEVLQATPQVAVKGEDDEDDDDDDDEEEEEEEEEILLDSERETIKLGISLVKLVKLLGRKITLRVVEPMSPPGGNETAIAWLDRLVNAYEESSRQVDEMSVAMYPRHEQAVIETAAVALGNVAKDLLDLAATTTAVVQPVDVEWFAKMRGHLQVGMAKLVPTFAT